jgi:branched-chain amino acid transport system substrate-binding protein
MVNALLDYAVKHQGVKRIAIVDDRTAYGQGIVKLFEAAAAERDVQIVDKQYTSDKATQFSSILTAIKGRKPDAIFFGGLDAQAGLMLRQMSQLAMNQVKFLGGDAQCSERLPAMADKVPALKNVVCVMSGSSLGNMPGGLLWKQKYDQRFPASIRSTALTLMTRPWCWQGHAECRFSPGRGLSAAPAPDALRGGDGHDCL